MKITLDASALKFLVEQNPEFLVQISQAVACDFAAKYLKPLLNDGALRAEIERAKESLTVEGQKAVADFIGTHSRVYGGWRFNLRDDIKEGIRAQVRSDMSDEVRSAIAQAGEQYTQEKIELLVANAVQTAVDRVTVRSIDDQVQARLNAIKASLSTPS